METHEAYEIIASSVVKIDTPQGSGTGFLITNGKHNDICGLATASHVIRHAHLWREPIKITHETSGKVRFLTSSDRVISCDPVTDIGSIVFNRSDLDFPDDPLPTTPQKKYLKIGTDVCWVGYPGVAVQSLCLFSGKISFWNEDMKAYLIDGVAINGVSGGPVFAIMSGAIVIVGVVSAYIPNRSTGEALPGLCMAKDVKHLHDQISNFENLDQAKKQKSEEDSEEIKANQSTTSIPVKDNNA